MASESQNLNQKSVNFSLQKSSKDAYDQPLEKHIFETSQRQFQIGTQRSFNADKRHGFNDNHDDSRFH